MQQCLHQQLFLGKVELEPTGYKGHLLQDMRWPEQI